MQLFPYCLPLTTPLTFAGQILTERRGVLIKLEQDDQVGWGDCAPLPGFSQHTLEQCIDALQHNDGTQPLPAEAQFAFDCAQLPWSTCRRVALPSAIPLLVGSPEQQLAQFDALAEIPHEVKLKLARAPLEQELKLVYALLARAPNLLLRIDANRLWSFAQAAEFALSAPLTNIRYVEEPCADLNDSLQVAKQYGLAIALDETTQQPDYQYQFLSGVKALVLKPSLIGSLARLQAITEQAQLDGLEVVLSSGFESNIGLTHLASLAAELTPHSTPGLDTLNALGADLIEPNLWQQPKPLISEQELCSQ